MKTTSSLLLALTLLNTAQAGLITDPLSVTTEGYPLILQGLITDPLSALDPQFQVPPSTRQEGFRPAAATGEPQEPRQTENGGHAVQVPVDYRSDSGMLPLNVDEMGEPVGYRRLDDGFIPSIVENGYRDTRFPNDQAQIVIKAEFPDYLPLDERLPIELDENGVPVTRDFANGTDVLDWIVGLIGDLSTDSTLRLSDLMMNPEVHAALHAPGPQGDELRGYVDWLIMTGLVIGFDGMDGSDDLYGDQGDDELADQAGDQSTEHIILGGPGGDTLQPYNPSVILGGPGGDTLQPDHSSIILGGPGGDTLQPYNPSIILGGPGGDTLAGDSQDHNPDVFND
ncbi:hypothetical protein SAMN02745166_02585 [Prosthecobacter debontii]|uniref:Hemolysin-type calcium-binding repeat-containing protein n=1 Tax=Prosthecobacter debontii TaxID=48467 RepID=A0A1T4Y628_9BACT|nr:hypothetical protein [Prosthecobacter debontii]SKA97267.1 hypothetical protein SAMN02745166_02585 [Prosthecobacter debontii]